MIKIYKRVLKRFRDLQIRQLPLACSHFFLNFCPYFFVSAAEIFFIQSFFLNFGVIIKIEQEKENSYP